MATKNGANLELLSFALPGEEHYSELNRLLRGIDALMKSRVISHTTTAPPASPADGDVYIVPASATGAWASQDQKIARWNADLAEPEWEFFTAKKGWVMRATGGVAGVQLEFNGTTWRTLAGLPEYADQAAASSLATGELFRTAAGAILVKL